MNDFTLACYIMELMNGIGRIDGLDLDGRTREMVKKLDAARAIYEALKNEKRSDQTQ